MLQQMDQTVKVRILTRNGWASTFGIYDPHNVTATNEITRDESGRLWHEMISDQINNRKADTMLLMSNNILESA